MGKGLLLLDGMNLSHAVSSSLYPMHGACVIEHDIVKSLEPMLVNDKQVWNVILSKANDTLHLQEQSMWSFG